jgi:hypothetical protein
MTLRLLCSSLLIASLLAPTVATAQEINNHQLSLQLGAQIKINAYRTGFKLAGYYSYWLKSIMWLDLGGGVVVHKDTDITFNGGIRWKFRTPADNVRPFVRTSVELGALQEDYNKFVFAFRGGGGATYYSSPGFGASVEASISAGPAFGNGEVFFASSLDIMLGVEFLF